MARAAPYRRLPRPPVRVRLRPARSGALRSLPAAAGTAGAGTLRHHRGRDRGLQSLRRTATGGPCRPSSARGRASPGPGGRNTAQGRPGLQRLLGQRAGDGGDIRRRLDADRRRWRAGAGRQRGSRRWSEHGGAFGTPPRVWSGLAGQGSRRCRSRSRRWPFVVLGRDVGPGPVANRSRGNERDHRADQDVNGDRQAGLVAAYLDAEPRRAGEESGGDQRRRTAGDHRGELVTERGAAVAETAGEAPRDQRRLWTVLHVVRDQREQDADEDQPRYTAVQQTEVDEAPDSHGGGPVHVHALAADPVREVAEDRDAEERNDGSRQHGIEDEVARALEDLGPVGEDVGGEDVEGRLLREAEKGGLDDLAPVAPDHQ